MKRQMKIASSRVPKKGKECFDKPVLSKAEGLSMNGKFSLLSILSPFVPSINSGQALSLLKGERIPSYVCLIDLICGQDY
jgi:hypothetical protein